MHCLLVHSVGGVCPAFIHSTNSSTLGSDAVQGCNIHQHQTHPPPATPARATATAATDAAADVDVDAAADVDDTDDKFTI